MDGGLGWAAGGGEALDLLAWSFPSGVSRNRFEEGFGTQVQHVLGQTVRSGEKQYPPARLEAYGSILLHGGQRKKSCLGMKSALTFFFPPTRSKVSSFPILW